VAGVTQGLDLRPAAQSQIVALTPAGLRQTRRWGVAITIGSFLFGFDTGIISGALLFIKRDLHLDSFEQSSVVSVLLLGAVAGALLSGRASDRFGRRATLGVLGVIFTIGIAITAIATGYWEMVAGRIVMGVGVGGVSATVPTYLAEISPAHIRGRMLTLNQLLIVIGLLASYLVNLAFAGSGNWRAMFWIGAVPGVLLVLASLRLPESPAWLFAHGRVADAEAMIASVTEPGGPEKVIARYEREEGERQRAEEEEGEGHTGVRALAAPHARPALIVALALAALQQFAGINTIIYYAPTIMQETGLNASNSIFYSVFIGVINLVVTIVSIRLIDRVGRRILLLVSLAGMAVTVGLLGVSFVADFSSGVILVGMMLYIVSFAIGMGPVFWVLLGEVFPPRKRAEGAAVGSTANWLSNFVVSLLFLPVVGWIGQGQTFFIFAAVSLAGLAFVARRVPETRQRNYLEVEADLHSRWTIPATDTAARTPTGS
jgi:MFS transporter, SP family, galactose:H+ symporter